MSDYLKSYAKILQAEIEKKRKELTKLHSQQSTVSYIAYEEGVLAGLRNALLWLGTEVLEPKESVLKANGESANEIESVKGK